MQIWNKAIKKREGTHFECVFFLIFAKIYFFKQPQLSHLR